MTTFGERAVMTPAAPFYTAATLDLTGWWRCVFTFTSWGGLPVSAANHPPQTDQLFCPPDQWQETTFINLGYRSDRSYVSDFGSGGDRMWVNVADHARGGDGHNGYLVQVSDQRQAPDAAGVRRSAGSWNVTAFVPPGGVGLLAALFGNSETQAGGDVNYLIARAANPPADGTVHPVRPTFAGTWVDVSGPSAGTFAMTPMAQPPPFPVDRLTPVA